MKKVSVLLLVVAICFANFSFGLVRIKPYVVSENKNTKIANLVKEISSLSGLENPNLIYPGQTLICPFPQPEDRFMLDVYRGDCLWTISNHLIFGDPRFPYVPQSLPKIKPVPAPAPVIPENKNPGFDWFWFLLVVAFVFLLLASYFAFKNEKLKDEKKKTAEENDFLKREGDLLAKELEKTRNQLPIIAPPIVDEWWLKNNYPISHVNDIDKATFPGIGIQGKKPNLIAQALVSTGENAISMLFSHNRKANTGLKNVAVWLGWNWNKKESKWEEVGMIASVCSNGFQVSPEKVVTMDQLFTNTGLVNNQYPVIYESDGIPKDTKYPHLLKSLVIKYHEKNIVDLRRAGAIVIPKN